MITKKKKKRKLKTWGVASTLLMAMMKNGFAQTPTNKVVYGKPHHFLQFQK
jgi:hypothetical protein